LWLDLARHSNGMAYLLRAGIGTSNSARLSLPTASNEVFAVVSKSSAKIAEEKCAKFYEWPVQAATPELVSESETLIRLVTSFATTEADVDGF
ncbi:low specificity L-threonine aldolase, partial [Rhizobium ruizarguesonis]